MIATSVLMPVEAFLRSRSMPVNFTRCFVAMMSLMFEWRACSRGHGAWSGKVGLGSGARAEHFRTLNIDTRSACSLPDWWNSKLAVRIIWLNWHSNSANPVRVWVFNVVIASHWTLTDVIIYSSKILKYHGLGWLIFAEHTILIKVLIKL